MEKELLYIVKKCIKYEKEYSPYTLPYPAYEIQSMLYGFVKYFLTEKRGKKIESWTVKNNKFAINNETT